MNYKCWCRECNKDVVVNGIPFSMNHMIVCPDCGNKRCPHATNHELPCTGSNDPGQPGGYYK